jgi:hypothetical protein
MSRVHNIWWKIALKRTPNWNLFNAPQKIKLRVDPLYGFELVIPSQAHMNGELSCVSVSPPKTFATWVDPYDPYNMWFKLWSGVEAMFKFKYFKITINNSTTFWMNGYGGIGS